MRSELQSFVPSHNISCTFFCRQRIQVCSKSFQCNMPYTSYMYEWPRTNVPRIHCCACNHGTSYMVRGLRSIMLYTAYALCAMFVCSVACPYESMWSIDYTRYLARATRVASFQTAFPLSKCPVARTSHLNNICMFTTVILPITWIRQTASRNHISYTYTCARNNNIYLLAALSRPTYHQRNLRSAKKTMDVLNYQQQGELFEEMIQLIVWWKPEGDCLCTRQLALPTCDSLSQMYHAIAK